MCSASRRDLLDLAESGAVVQKVRRRVREGSRGKGIGENTSASQFEEMMSDRLLVSQYASQLESCTVLDATGRGSRAATALR